MCWACGAAVSSLSNEKETDLLLGIDLEVEAARRGPPVEGVAACMALEVEWIGWRGPPVEELVEEGVAVCMALGVPRPRLAWRGPPGVVEGATSCMALGVGWVG